MAKFTCSLNCSKVCPFSDGASQLRLTSVPGRGWTFCCKCFHLMRCLPLNPNCSSWNNMEVWDKAKKGRAVTEHQISGGLWWIRDLGAGLVVGFASALWISLFPEPASLRWSSTAPTKTKISPTYLKQNNLWNLWILPINRSSESEYGNQRQTP